VEGSDGEHAALAAALRELRLVDDEPPERIWVVRGEELICFWKEGEGRYMVAGLSPGAPWATASRGGGVGAPVMKKPVTVPWFPHAAPVLTWKRPPFAFPASSKKRQRRADPFSDDEEEDATTGGEEGGALPAAAATDAFKSELIKGNVKAWQNVRTLQACVRAIADKQRKGPAKNMLEGIGDRLLPDAACSGKVPAAEAIKACIKHLTPEVIHLLDVQVITPEAEFFKAKNTHLCAADRAALLRGDAAAWESVNNLQDCLLAAVNTLPNGTHRNKYEALAKAIPPDSSGGGDRKSAKEAAKACAERFATAILENQDIVLLGAGTAPPYVPVASCPREREVERIHKATTVFEMLGLDPATDTNREVFVAAGKVLLDVFPPILVTDETTGLHSRREVSAQEQLARTKLAAVMHLLTAPREKDIFPIYVEAHAHMTALTGGADRFASYRPAETHTAADVVEALALSLIRHHSLFRQAGHVFRRDAATLAYKCVAEEKDLLLSYLFARGFEHTTCWLKRQLTPLMQAECPMMARLAVEWPETAMKRGWYSCPDGMFNIYERRFYRKVAEAGSGSAAPPGGSGSAAPPDATALVHLAGASWKDDAPAGYMPPGYAKIIGTQEWSESKVLIFEGLMGRCLFPLGELDHWELSVMLHGVPGCGKTKFGDMCASFFPVGTAATISGGKKTAVGSFANLRGAMLVYFAECPRDGFADLPGFREFWNKVVAGERGVQYQLPGRPISTVEGPWTAPSLHTGNYGLRWTDESKSRWRRVVYVCFFKAVADGKGDPTLVEKLQEEAVHIIQRWTVAYASLRERVRAHGGSFHDWLRRHDPEMYAEGEEVESHVDRMEHFLQDCMWLRKSGGSRQAPEEGAPFRSTLKAYNQAYGQWMNEHHPRAKARDINTTDMLNDVQGFVRKHSLPGVTVHTYKVAEHHGEEQSMCWLLGACVSFGVPNYPSGKATHDPSESFVRATQDLQAGGIAERVTDVLRRRAAPASTQLASASRDDQCAAAGTVPRAAGC
jgi:hypothetical protein